MGAVNSRAAHSLRLADPAARGQRRERQFAAARAGSIGRTIVTLVRGRCTNVSARGSSVKGRAMTGSRSWLYWNGLLLAAVLCAASPALAKGGGHSRVTSHSLGNIPHEGSSNGKSKHPGGANTTKPAPSAHRGPPPYKLDEDGHLMSEKDESDSGERGMGGRSSLCGEGAGGSAKGDRE